MYKAKFTKNNILPHTLEQPKMNNFITYCTTVNTILKARHSDFIEKRAVNNEIN